MTRLVDCSEEERKASLRKHPRPKKTAGDRWADRIRLKYGLTPDQVAEKWGEQGGLCPICEQELAEKTWVIDHDHKTERFRGILCNWCNHRVVSMAERGGWLRAYNTIRYLWQGLGFEPLT